MKVIWNLDYSIAIPLSNICCFEISNIDEWGKKCKDEWKGSRYFVIANYAICTGHGEIVFTSDLKEECMQFINNIYEDNR